MGSMRKSGLSQPKQLRLIEHFVSGTTARTAASLCGVHRTTAAYYFLRLREIIAYEREAESEAMFGGEIEVDESDFGGKRIRKAWSRCCRQNPCLWLIKKGSTGFRMGKSQTILNDVVQGYFLRRYSNERYRIVYSASGTLCPMAHHRDYAESGR